jgi:acetyl-CoA carboxylase carboxyl transferase subunit beta
MSPSSATTISGARERIALVADPGSFQAWDEDVVSDDPYEFSDVRPYVERLREATEKTGSTEAVVCGRAAVGGRPVGIVAAEFGFLGGSIGVATGERVARMLERCLEERLPVVAVPASGGTRMQEGTVALLQMAKISAAVGRFRRAGLPYLVYLTHPATGGVFASWGSLGTVTWAMPHALLGFGGPRVVELMTGTPLPEGVQVAENLLAHGLLDDVFPPSELRHRVARALDVLDPAEARAPAGESGRPPEPARGIQTGDAPRDARASLILARHPDRPSARDLLERGANKLTVLRGDRSGRPDDPSCLTALSRFDGVPCVVVAQDRDRPGRRPAVMGPAGYRKARRAIALAGELALPLLTVLDTPGAEMSVAAEEGGLSFELAGCLAEMSALRSPTVSVILGEGGSGGASALLPADRVVCAHHAFLAPIAPEGASAILYRTVERADELADAQGIGSWDLERFGIVDVVVAESPSADQEPEAFLDRMQAAIGTELRRVVRADHGERLAARERRYRQMGNPMNAPP